MDRRQKQLLLLSSRAILFSIVVRLFPVPHILPHGPAVTIPRNHRPVTTTKFDNVVSLTLDGGKLTKIYERVDDDENDDGSRSNSKEPLLTGPETILFDNEGIMYIMNENAKLISLTDFRQKDNDTPGDDPSILTAKTTEVADLGMGRPLGGQFDKRGECLYYADAIVGLARICNLPPPHEAASSPKANVELLASRVQLSDGTYSPIHYADDVAIGPKTGHVYFSDASNIPTDKDVYTDRWDVMYASKMEGLRGKCTGRLLRYKPESGEVDLLTTDACFANGVAVDAEETFVLYTSTYDGVVMKYPLGSLSSKGRRTIDETTMEDGDGSTGGAKRILDRFPGFLDGATCSSQRNGLCYVAVPSTVPTLVKVIFSLPSWLSVPLRTLLLIIPRTWSPKPDKYGGVAELHPGNEKDGVPARILRVFQDADGRDVSMITGVTEHDGKLYLGSLHNDFVGVLSLD
mmetsp:Transcript_8156/g.17625  ORF Transcript_8156/g.17625 Transcript_8156/m.17625 type:complete len:461 (-) Transcript_8156:201-1583(-)|eukprot:CAMPEP_0183718844 /NCGR_PEP_ID=MMETSP0737-20130205/11994_1 /TAXON_ID=385413 /ORGANISM="Thalassiosira miniscula, Strain CCMP1093" /LENGTH=460 /DNA_ID=CAMNT_0025948477 /DNA_START=32 /DNA_END=1414 /DNA_ORIENTATION=-